MASPRRLRAGESTRRLAEQLPVEASRAAKPRLAPLDCIVSTPEHAIAPRIVRLLRRATAPRGWLDDGRHEPPRRVCRSPAMRAFAVAMRGPQPTERGPRRSRRLPRWSPRSSMRAPSTRFAAAEQAQRAARPRREEIAPQTCGTRAMTRRMRPAPEERGGVEATNGARRGRRRATTPKRSASGAASGSPRTIEGERGARPRRGIRGGRDRRRLLRYRETHQPAEPSSEKARLAHPARRRRATPNDERARVKAHVARDEYRACSICEIDEGEKTTRGDAHVIPCGRARCHQA